MSKHLTPARVCERQFGGPKGVADILGIGEKAPYGWHHPSNGRDAGDLPSTRYMRMLLEHADKHLIPLEPDWLINGATEAEIAALQPDRSPIAFARAEQAARARIEAAE